MSDKRITRAVSNRFREEGTDPEFLELDRSAFVARRKLEYTPPSKPLINPNTPSETIDIVNSTPESSNQITPSNQVEIEETEIDVKENWDNSAIIPLPSPPIIITMANTHVPLKDALKIVPLFDGQKDALGLFFDGCDEAKEMVGTDQETILTKLVRCKLTGEARKTIRGRSFGTINDLKIHLKTIYAPTKTVGQLRGELGREFQKNNEQVITFANRIRELMDKILEVHEINSGKAASDEFKKELISEIIDCFRRGLKPEIELNMKEVKGMDDAFKEALNAERRIEARFALRNQSQTNPLTSGLSDIMRGEERHLP